MQLRGGERKPIHGMLELRQFAQLGFQHGGELEEFRRVRALQRELILALGEIPSDANGRRILQEDPNAGYGGEFGAQFFDHLIRTQAPLGARLQSREHASVVGGGPSLTSTHIGTEGIHVRVCGEYCSNLLLVPGAGFGAPGYFRIAYCVDRGMIERSLPAWQALAKEVGLA